MGILIVMIAAIFEVAFAVFCVRTHSNQQKIRGMVRIGALAVFLIFTLVSVIEWSFRWMALALLLFIWALLGLWTLLRRKEKHKVYKWGRVVGRAVIMFILVIIAAVPAIVFPQYRLPQVTGEYGVATKTYTYIDKNRIEEFTDTGANRFVNVEFWYPEHATGTHPLLVFSHGAYGIKESNASTYMELASHGYVVCSIDHPYHSFYTVSEGGKITMASQKYLQEFGNGRKDGAHTVEEYYKLMQKWMKLRTDDMNFVIDTILEKAKSNSDKVYQLVNPEKIGVFGHSMGGAASAWLGRERHDVTAVVNIDGPLFSDIVYNKEKNNFESTHQAYKLPLLNIYSDSVWQQLDSSSYYAGNKTVEESGGEVHTVYFRGAKHLSLTDLSLFSPMLANMLLGEKAEIDKYKCLETMNRIILEFFDSYLKGKGSFTSAGTY
ncbi:alpha/beta hydrolase [Paenibacillus sp.]|jgi:dienelactone hydrolase|uniref:alpha/beta hydrolase n=1 Tax=Paenibacillus sp. TaxID=58172 RepID=UPI002831C61C|nr:alpha/beta hydrolase [Paenibacillus sp.]MDR0267209.1 alpha/beta hydrolase [Paenibacillus sp.]